jgi:hypothetical protein
VFVARASVYSRASWIFSSRVLIKQKPTLNTLERPIYEMVWTKANFQAVTRINDTRSSSTAFLQLDQGHPSPDPRAVPGVLKSKSRW